MPRTNIRRSVERITGSIMSMMMGAFLVLTAHPVHAQQQEYQLFDRISLAFEGSWAVMDTVIRLDSKTHGMGTELDFENDGGLDESKLVPTLSFEWMMGRRHRLSGWWMRVDRDSTNTVLEEIRFGDKVFPIEAEVLFLLGTDEIALQYTYYVSRKTRHAVGLGGGFRTLKTTLGLAAQNLEISEEGDFTAPLPFFLIDYRFGFSPKWRLIADAGVFYIELGEFSGSQYVLDAWVEYLASKRVSLGAGLRGTRVDADMKTEGVFEGEFRGLVKMSTAAARLFVRVRF